MIFAYFFKKVREKHHRSLGYVEVWKNEKNENPQMTKEKVILFKMDIK